jgi:hypothetical protein
VNEDEAACWFACCLLFRFYLFVKVNENENAEKKAKAQGQGQKCNVQNAH